MKQETCQREFKSKPYCTRDETSGGENSVLVYVSDAESYNEPIHPNLTIYRSIKTNEITGCKIYGIAWPMSGLELAHMPIAASEIGAESTITLNALPPPVIAIGPPPLSNL